MLDNPMASQSLPQYAGRLRIGIAIATADRPAILREAVGLIGLQTRKPDAILVCAPSERDFDGLREDHSGVRCCVGPRGLPHQRNRLLETGCDLDVVVFLDDDFVMAPDYLAETEAAFSDDPSIAMTTGRVVADGILGRGFSFGEALERLAISSARRENSRAPVSQTTPVYNAYGCNMAVRMATVRARALKFDEELPLYAWLEDVDFSRSIAPFGRIVRLGLAQGVHLGVKSGRQRGIRLGYSQIANPCYLIAKGTCSWRKGLFNMSKNFAANTWGALRGEKAVDRAGRLRGNAEAIRDLITFRLAPSRALRL